MSYKSLLRRILRLPKRISLWALRKSCNFFPGCMTFLAAILRKLDNYIERAVHPAPAPFSRISSVYDLYFMNSRQEENLRWDMVVRYLAIENYYGKNDYGFALYEKMQRKRMGDEWPVQAIPRFKALIESYEKKGYDLDSAVEVNEKLELWDGSHRMALGLYFKQSLLKVKICHGLPSVAYSRDWFIEKGFTQEELDHIKDKDVELAKQCRDNGFVCIVWAPAAAFIDEIVRDMAFYGKVSNITKIECDKQGVYDNFVRALYAIDDIASWKIEKKIEYMRDCGKTFYAFDLILDEPDFRLKTSTNLPLSRKVERIKKALRNKYKAKVSNYFYDTILHIGDNYLQSEYMRRVLNPGLDIKVLFRQLESFNYRIVKSDVPYKSTHFPDIMPVGKDIDILCAPDDFDALHIEVLKWASAYNYRYEIHDIPNEIGAHIRIEYAGKLILQIDIATSFDSIPLVFTERAVAEPCVGNTGEICGKILDDKYEVLARLLAYDKSPIKRYHLEWAQGHCTEEGKKLLASFAPQLQKYIDGKHTKEIVFNKKDF